MCTPSTSLSHLNLEPRDNLINLIAGAEQLVVAASLAHQFCLVSLCHYPKHRRHFTRRRPEISRDPATAALPAARNSISVASIAAGTTTRGRLPPDTIPWRLTRVRQTHSYPRPFSQTISTLRLGSLETERSPSRGCDTQLDAALSTAVLSRILAALSVRLQWRNLHRCHVQIALAAFVVPRDRELEWPDVESSQLWRPSCCVSSCWACHERVPSDNPVLACSFKLCE